MVMLLEEAMVEGDVFCGGDFCGGGM